MNSQPESNWIAFTFKEANRRQLSVTGASDAQTPKSLSQTPFPHWPVSPLILIGLTFTDTILITSQQNATEAGCAVTACFEVY